jgi:hypothetical protein
MRRPDAPATSRAAGHSRSPVYSIFENRSNIYTTIFFFFFFFKSLDFILFDPITVTPERQGLRINIA